MKVYRLTWLTTDGHRHVGAPRFLTQDAAERVGKMLRGDPVVQSVAVEPVFIRPVALPVPAPVLQVSPRWHPAA